MATPTRAPKHPVMRPCLETMAIVTAIAEVGQLLSEPLGRLRFGFCLGRSLNFREVSNQTL